MTNEELKELCAKICDKIGDSWLEGEDATPSECAAAIRAIELPKAVVSECFTTADLEKQVSDLKESLQWLIEQIEEQTDAYAIESSIAFDLAKDRAK